MKKAIRSVLAVIICLSVVVLSGCSASDYKEAERLIAEGEYEAAAEIWKALGDYKDADSRLTETNQAISYAAACAYLDEDDYDQAYNAFIMLGVYGDSAEMASESLYRKAGVLLEGGNYSEAADLYEKLGEYKDCEELRTQSLYLYAGSLIERCSYERARVILSGLDGYLDSETLLQEIEVILEAQSEISTAEAGSLVYFGSYEQDGNAENGAENLAWIVLAKDENKMLLLCRDGIETLKYNTGFEATDWENCSLRIWLNSDFKEKAFSESEAALLMPLLDAAGSEESEIFSEVFLLSAAEFDEYLAPYPDFASAVPTVLAEDNGAGVRTNRCICWWLRDSGFCSKYAAYVGSDGTVNANGIYCDSRSFCVRPAVWIRLSDSMEDTFVTGTSARPDGTGYDTSLPLAETPDTGEEYINSIIFMGDSTTFGYTNIGMTEKQLWSAASHTMTLYEQSYVNIMTIKGGMPIRKAAETFKPEMLVITLGLKQITLMNETLFKSEYTDLITGIQEASPETKIIINTVYPVASFVDRTVIPVNNEMIDTVNIWAKDVAEETGVRFIDTNSALKDSNGYLRIDLVRTDAVHLDNPGLYFVLDYIRTHAYI